MTVIGEKRNLVGNEIHPRIERAVESIHGRGYFGSSESGVMVVAWGKVEIPSEIAAAIN